MSWVERLKEKLAQQGLPSKRTEPTAEAVGGFGRSHPPPSYENPHPPKALPPSSETLRVERQAPRREISQTGVPPQLTEPTKGASGGFDSAHPPPLCENTHPPGVPPSQLRDAPGTEPEPKGRDFPDGGTPQLTEPTKGAFGGFGSAHPLAPWENPPPAIPHEDQQAIDERAAIGELDGGEPRAVAEREARSAIRVYQYRITDKPTSWLTLIAPGCDLEEARRIVTNQFGAARVLDVVPHRASGIGARSPDEPPSIERGNNT